MVRQQQQLGQHATDVCSHLQVCVYAEAGGGVKSDNTAIIESVAEDWKNVRLVHAEREMRSERCPKVGIKRVKWCRTPPPDSEIMEIYAG